MLPHNKSVFLRMLCYVVKYEYWQVRILYLLTTFVPFTFSGLILWCILDTLLFTKNEIRWCKTPLSNVSLYIGYATQTFMTTLISSYLFTDRVLSCGIIYNRPYSPFLHRSGSLIGNTLWALFLLFPCSHAGVVSAVDLSRRSPVGDGQDLLLLYFVCLWGSGELDVEEENPMVVEQVSYLNTFMINMLYIDHILIIDKYIGYVSLSHRL